MNLQHLIEVLGHDTQAYSGRGMMGKYCLGVAVLGHPDIWRLACQLGMHGFDDPPVTDQFGHGLIAYWPGIEYT